MSKFKVGDKVRILPGTTYFDSVKKDIGTVVSVNDLDRELIVSKLIWVDGVAFPGYLSYNDVELVEFLPTLHEVRVETPESISISYEEDVPELWEEEDVVNHPSHYTKGFSNGAEVIDIVENLPYNAGAAVKYLARAGKKDATKEIEDLLKARWYVNRQLSKLGHTEEEN